MESVIEDYVCERAAAQGWYVRKLKWIGRLGAPDRFFAKGGRIVFIEFKRPGEKARRTQKDEIEEMKAAGIEVHVCDTPTQALRILGVTRG